MLLNQYGLPFPPVEERVYGPRYDNWQNHLTGIGTQSDKTSHGRFFPTFRVLDQELTNLHNGSDLAAHVVDRRPKEMFRRGYDLEAEGINASQTKAIRDFATDILDLDTNMREAFRWGRLYGGCLLLLNVDDGNYPWEPLDEDNIRSFTSVSVVDRRYAYVQSQYSSLNAGKYGRPEIYLISNAVACSGWNSYGAVQRKSGMQIAKEGGQVSMIHESRVLRFDGNDADVVTRQQLAGWSWSVLQRVYDAMRQFEHAYDSVGYLLADANQGVYKLQGLIKAITSGQRQAFADRLLAMEMTRSVLRGIALDAGDPGKGNGEEFSRVSTTFAGIPDLLDRMMLRLAAAFEEPATILFGRAPAGLQASGDNEIRAWYDTIGTEQENELTPRLKRVYRLLGLAKRGPISGGKDLRFDIKHRPLWSPTDAETADVTLKKSQRDQIYISEGCVTPEEVAVDLEDIYPNLDVDAREQVIKAKKSFDPYPNDEPEEPAAPNGGKVGASSPTSAAIVSGAGGEPLGGPQVPIPIIGDKPKGEGTPAKSPAPVAIPAKTKSAGTASKSGAAKLPKKAGAPASKGAPNGTDEQKADGNATSVAVYHQLEEDFPEEAVAWVLSYDWTGPVSVPLSQVDFSNAASWQASKEPVAVAFHTIRIAEGIRKPVILVRVQGEKLFNIADGHHRSLGYQALGEPVVAHCVTVPKSERGWQPMHDEQKGKSNQKSQQRSDQRADRVHAYRARFDQRYPALDAHDPEQPRERGRLSSNRATALAAAAFDLSDTAADVTGHHEAATAHAVAALEYRRLVARHGELGNVAAARRHTASAEQHQACAADHFSKAGIGNRGDGDAPTETSTAAADTPAPDQESTEA